MTTQFTVTINKGKSNEKAFTVNVGEDVLANHTESEIYEMAHQSKVIKLQAPLRKMEDESEMQEYLRKTYPDATVSEGVVKAPSANAKLNAIIAKFGGDKEAAMTALENFLNQS